LLIFDSFLKRRLILVLSMVWPLSGHAQRLLIIASPLVTENRISMKELADIYIMKQQEWPGGIRVVPVNREVTSPERAEFSKQVFHLSPQQMADYWNRLRFQGKLPPSVQTSDQAVLNFVRTIPGAIGYVHASTLPKDVKVLMELQ
jgi:ABC-type phosphate transport system substrate-binding protein